MFKLKQPLRFWVAIIVLCLLLGFSFDFGSSDSKAGVSKSNCDCIQVGMTEKEVEAILGGPASRVAFETLDGPVKDWVGPRCSVGVAFSQGRVLFPPFYYKKPTLLDRTLEWLGLRSKNNMQSKS
jgi:hypothetical protein